MKAIQARRLVGWLFLAAAAHATAQVREQAVTLTTASGQLAGTLTLPAAPARAPVALIIAGSGPTDRDGNSALAPGHNDSLRMLAAALAGNGVASLRYDKRGIGASASAMTAESALRLDTYVDDAQGWLGQLKADPRFSRVVVIGHSEGSLIGMLAAQRAGAAAFVSVSGVAQSASTIMRRQWAGKLPPDLAAENERILATLERGELPQAVPAPLAGAYRPSVQPYLVSWIKYVPAQQIATLRMPVLIVQGTTDVQVGVDQAQALKAAKPDAELAIIQGMNHVLKLVPDDSKQQQASYADPTLPLAPQLVGAIVDFVHAKQTGQR
jgi:pimeloyl-ACP methyl ester carboxylesterase